MEKLFFLLFATVAVIAALGVVGSRNPVHSALSLIVCFLQISAIFVLLRSPFLAAVQVFIYVGAVMVFFLFVVMVLDMKKARLEVFPSRKKWFLYAVLPVMTIEFLMVIFGSGLEGMGTQGAGEMTVEQIGKALFTKYLLPFEILSVVLLAAMVGAIVMVRKKWD